MSIESNLKYYREQHGKTQKEIAKILGVAPNTYNQYETGKRKPYIETLIKLADYYMMSLDVLTGRINLGQKKAV